MLTVRRGGPAVAALLAVALLAPAGATGAGPVTAASVNPAVSVMDPASAPNDIGTSVTITGADFAAVMDGAGTSVVTSPTASLGATALTNVTWVNATTVTATVPWGMNPGVYALTVVNPDGGTGSLAGAFTVTQGIGQWNGGDLFGGDVGQILMKPDDPDTLYASAREITGLFRSDDAGEHWAHVSAAVGINNGKFAIDPHNPSWLYGYAADGLYRSQDEGDTWTKVMPNTWPDGRAIDRGQVYVSPHHPDVLFLSSYHEGGGSPGGAMGLIRSTDGGATWQVVADMEGIGVEAVAFHPTVSSQMVLATPDARVFQSIDGGAHWSEVLKPPLSSLGFEGSIAYNPYRPVEVWIASTIPGQSLQKSIDADFSSWQNVTPVDGISSSTVTFTGADSVYSGGYHSQNGGLSWLPFDTSGGGTTVLFDPHDPKVGYVGHPRYAVEKTTDGGRTWEPKNQGLAGMHCYSLEASRADPLRVFAAFVNWPGIYRSDDGANNWTFLPIDGSIGVWVVHEDPSDPRRLYVSADSGFYVSTNGGESWTDLGWNLPSGAPAGMKNNMAPDPHHQGHLLVGLRPAGGALLYASSDYGATWQSIDMPQVLSPIESIVFDPETAGLVYLTTAGTGVYRSTDSGTTWTRIDDRQQSQMQNLNNITIATHPQHVLFAGAPNPCRSTDDGAIWQCGNAPPAGASAYMFADGDSTRLYAATSAGLYFSSDTGNSWERAAGAFGLLQILEMGYAVADGHTILYAATSGAMGTTSAAVNGPMTSSSSPRALSTTSTLVEAGIYRHVQVATTATFTSLAAEDGWILESGHTSNKGGTLNATATTLRLGDDRAKKQYRAILSFNTGAGLPDTAVITGVTLRLKRQGVSGGGNPVTTFRGFDLDIRNGVFGTAALKTSDFGAAASRTFGPFKPSPVGGWYSFDLTGAKASVNRLSTQAGRTQLRLRFKIDDNSNKVANYLSLFSGNAAAAARPQLLVTYYVP
jgi:photosystem II stability/assembly factor-like uncharacterized protein